MLFLFALALAAALTLSCSKAIKKHAYVFYGAALILSVLFGFVRFTGLPAWLNRYGPGLFQRGALATAMWVIVMFTGALPAGSPLRKIWMPIRGQMSILAAILSLCHNITFGKTYFVALVKNSAMLTSQQLAAAIISIVMLAIMIPLTVMSFPQVRRKMNAKRWKQIQRLAYLFYGLLYVHILLIMAPMARMGIWSYQLDVCLYSLVFLAYAICRVQKALLKGKPESARKAAQIVGAVVLAAAMIGVVLLVQAPAKKDSPVTPAETTLPTVSGETTVPSVSTEPSASTGSAETTAGADAETTVPETTSSVQDTTAGTEASASTEQTVPETTASPSETTAPETTVPETTDGSVPETTVPETTVPETTVPETTVPETTVPETTVPETTAVPRTYNDGTYTGYGEGYDDPSKGKETVTAIVTIENDQIVSIEAYSSLGETYFFKIAKDGVISSVLGSQSGSVDTVSGATYSSQGLIDAINSALAQARV